MTTISRECECGSKALKDGSRCAKCGKPLPRKRSTRAALPDFTRALRTTVAEPTSDEVTQYERKLDEAEPIVKQMLREGTL